MKNIFKDISNYYKENESEFGRGIFLIIIGVLITTLVYPPIATNIIQFILKILGFIDQRLQDIFYSEWVQKAESNERIEGLLYFLVMCISLLFFLIKLTYDGTKLRIQLAKYELLSELLLHFKDKKIKIEELVEKDMLKDKTNSKSKIEKKKFIPDKFKENFLFIFVLLLMFLAMSSLTAGSLRKTFERQLIQLIPYVSQEKITELKIDWTYITSKADFDSLNSKIDRYFKENKVPTH